MLSEIKFIFTIFFFLRQLNTCFLHLKHSPLKATHYNYRFTYFELDIYTENYLLIYFLINNIFLDYISRYLIINIEIIFLYQIEYLSKF